MSRKKSQEAEYTFPAAERYKQRLTAETTRDIKITEDWFAKKLEEQYENPELHFLLENLRDYIEFRTIEKRQFLQLLAVGMLWLIPAVLKAGELEVLWPPALILWIIVFVLASYRFIHTLEKSTQELKGLLDEFTQRGFSPSNVSLDYLPKVWRGIENHDLIADILFKVAQEHGFFTDKNVAELSLDALLDDNTMTERVSLLELGDEGEIHRLKR